MIEYAELRDGELFISFRFPNRNGAFFMRAREVDGRFTFDVRVSAHREHVVQCSFDRQSAESLCAMSKLWTSIRYPWQAS